MEKENKERYISYLKQQSKNILLKTSDRNYYKKLLEKELAVNENC